MGRGQEKFWERRHIEHHCSVDEIHLAPGKVDQAIRHGVKRVHVEYCSVFLPNVLSAYRDDFCTTLCSRIPGELAYLIER